MVPQSGLKRKLSRDTREPRQHLLPGKGSRSREDSKAARLQGRKAQNFREDANPTTA
jgi:hypothetical protein